MSAEPAGHPRFLADLWNAFEDALPQVHGYLLRRTGSAAVAEDLTGATFLAAVERCRGGGVERVSIAWLVGIARHKLIDHWRSEDAGRRRQQRLEAVEATAAPEEPWDVTLDVLLAHDVLRSLSVDHRAALTLRYLDDLPVLDVAATLGRTLLATEALLVRARRAFRTAYEELADTEEGR